MASFAVSLSGSMCALCPPHQFPVGRGISRSFAILGPDGLDSLIPLLAASQPRLPPGLENPQPLEKLSSAPKALGVAPFI